MNERSPDAAAEALKLKLKAIQGLIEGLNRSNMDPVERERQRKPLQAEADKISLILKLKKRK